MHDFKGDSGWAATSNFLRFDLEAPIDQVHTGIKGSPAQFLIFDDPGLSTKPVYVVATKAFRSAIDELGGRRGIDATSLKRLLSNLEVTPAPRLDLDEAFEELRLTGKVMRDFVKGNGVVSFKGDYAHIVYDKTPDPFDPVSAFDALGVHASGGDAADAVRTVDVFAVGQDGSTHPLNEAEVAGGPEVLPGWGSTGSRFLQEPPGGWTDTPKSPFGRGPEGSGPAPGDVTIAEEGVVEEGVVEEGVVEEGVVGEGVDEESDTPRPVTGLQVRVPARVERERTATVAVNITRLGGANADIPFGAEAGDVISAVVWPVEGVEIVGGDTAELTVAADGQDRGGRVTVKAVGSERGAVMVQAFKGQTELGSVVVGFAIVEPGQPAHASEQIAAPIQVTDGAGPDSDVALHIVELKHPDTAEPGLGFVLIERGQPPRSFGFQGLKIDPRAKLHQLFDLLDAAVSPRPSVGQVDNLVRAIGVQLYEKLLPPSLRDYLLAQLETITSVVVHSEEPTIPWEMCLVTRVDADGRTHDVGYLCELFALTRWLPKSRKPAAELAMRSLGYIAPNDAGLPAQADEVAMLENLRSRGVAVAKIKATLDGATSTFTGDQYDVLHFSGHGRAHGTGLDATPRLDLAGDDYLIPSMLLGSWTNFGRRAPVVFFNACRTGRADLDLGGLGGWAPYVLDAGASMFVGSHWNVVDGAALEFATHLYDALLAGTPVGEAVRSARLAIKQAGDPTWLAYAVYAPPTAARA